MKRNKYLKNHKSTDETERSNKKFWEELIDYVPLIRHGQHRKRKIMGVGAVQRGATGWTAEESGFPARERFFSSQHPREL
jgi:hypothetical protein